MVNKKGAKAERAPELPSEVQEEFLGIRAKRRRILISTILVIVLIGIIYIIFSLFSIKSCDTEQCFIERANLCKQTTFEQDFAGSTVLYTTKDCVLTKEITEFSGDEPIEIVELFKGKKMQCYYEKDNFNELLIEDLTSGIEDCEGELKDAIYELRIAQLALE